MKLSLIVCAIAVFSCACASIPFKKERFHAIERFDIVSLDEFTLGEEIKGTMELRGNRFDKNNFIVITIFDADGKANFAVRSEFMYSNGLIAFRVFESPNEDMIGIMSWEKRSDGDYLTINFPADPYDIKDAEEQLSFLRHDQRTVGADLSSLIGEQEAKVEKLKKGRDWVFKRK